MHSTKHQTTHDGSRGGDLTLLEARAIHKSFRLGSQEIRVLKGVDLCLDRGKILVILGASGVGKSTLLHILGTLERPSGGDVLFEGQRLFDWPDSRLARFRNIKLGFVFQFHHLLPELTALENVMIPGLVKGGARVELEAKAGALLDEVGLSHRLGHKPSELSGGELQRVALARALFWEPALVLADEPTGNLDPDTGEKLHHLIYNLARKRQQSWVIVTHNEKLAGMADKKTWLVDGILTEDENRSPSGEDGENPERS
jgi:lipoprotein-releasing system ATP-binding protein